MQLNKELHRLFVFPQDLADSGKWSTGILNQTIQGAAIISVNNIIYVAGGYVNGSISAQVWKLEF